MNSNKPTAEEKLQERKAKTAILDLIRRAKKRGAFISLQIISKPKK